MKKFLTKPAISWVGGRLPWCVKEPIPFQSDALGLVTVPAGYLTDLASVPRLPLIYLIVGGRASAAAMLHDFAYSNACTWCPTREQADALFLEAMEDANDPASRTKRWIMYQGVRLGGGRRWRRDKVAPHEEA